ncbi:cell wall hydrolase [Pseudomonas saliphila]|uniref:cell wall hydrolase n=1 Tax=Pseudomonas saliphila TaxID=2586906 RepID=UPI00123A0749|nr:cell wall hydrolase [Pseudomonas saliphila]
MRLTRIAIYLTALTCLSQPLSADMAERAEAAITKAETLEQNTAEQGDVTRADPDDTITKAESRAVDPAGEAPLDDAITCLARSIYWEAKGDGADSMEAVASVVLNRLADGGFPETVCEVVKQGSEQGACQFSWWCDGRSDTVQEEEPYRMATEIARKALNGQLKDRTDGALYFHDRSVAPGWSDTFVKTAEIGDLFFYKPN